MEEERSVADGAPIDLPFLEPFAQQAERGGDDKRGENAEGHLAHARSQHDRVAGLVWHQHDDGDGDAGETRRRGDIGEPGENEDEQGLEGSEWERMPDREDMVFSLGMKE